MTTAQKKNYLSKVKEYDHKIKAAQEELLEALSQSGTTINYSGMPKGGAPSGTKTELSIEKTEQIKTKISELKTRQNNIKRDIIIKLQKMPHQELADLLKYRYVDGLTWREVANKLHTTKGYARNKMHLKALKEFKL